MANKIEIIIEASDKASATIKGIDKALEGTGEAAKKASTGFKDIATALGAVTLVAGGVAAALKQVYDAGLQGAQQAQMEESFNRLGVSMDELMQASRGTVDDFDLMAATLKIASGASEELLDKLLPQAPQLLEIAKAANKMNPALGDTGTLYENIADAIKRVQPRQLAALGLTVKAEDANRAYAESIGKSADALTTEEQQMALLNATMLAGDRLMEQVGGNVDSQTDKYLQLAMQMDDAGDSIKKLTDTLAGPFVLALGRGASATLQAIENLGALRVLVPLLAGDYGSFMTAILNTNDAQEKAAEVTKLNAKAVAAGTAAMAQGFSDVGTAAPVAEAAIAKVTDGSFDLYWRMRDVKTVSLGLEDVVYGSAEAWRDYQSAVDGANASNQQFDAGSVTQQIEAVGLAAMTASERMDLIKWGTSQTLTENLEEGAKSLEELRAEQAALIVELDKLNASQGRAITVTTESSQTTAEAALTTLQLADANAKLAAETDPLKAAQLAVKIEDLSGKLGEAATTTTTYIDNTKKVAELQGTYDGITAEIDTVIAKMREMSSRFVLGLIEMQIAADGAITPLESRMYTAYARGAGLIDDLAVKQASGVADILTRLDRGLLDGTQATNELMTLAASASDSYITMQTTAVEAMEGINTSMMFMGDTADTEFGAIEGAARSSAGGIDEAASAVGRVKFWLDQLYDKDVTVNVTTIEHRGVGYTPSESIKMAEGGDYYVSSPTHFVAGEAGAERAIFIPRGEPGYDADLGALLAGLTAPLPASSGGSGVMVTGDGGTRIGTVNLTVNGTSDARETARLVMREFQDRGFIPRMPLR